MEPEKMKSHPRLQPRAHEKRATPIALSRSEEEKEGKREREREREKKGRTANCATGCTGGSGLRVALRCAAGCAAGSAVQGDMKGKSCASQARRRCAGSDPAQRRGLRSRKMPAGPAPFPKKQGAESAAWTRPETFSHRSPGQESRLRSFLLKRKTTVPYEFVVLSTQRAPTWVRGAPREARKRETGKSTRKRRRRPPCSLGASG